MPSLPSRRRLLQLVGASASISLAGCTRLTESFDNSSTPSRFPHVSINQDSVATQEAEYDIRILQQFTSTHPAKVEISFRNKTDTTQEFAFSAAPPFSGLLGRPATNPRDGLVLVPEQSDGHADFYDTEEPHEKLETPTEVIPDEPSGGCWKAEGTLDHEPIGTTRTINSGSDLSNTYTILESAKGSDCFHSNRYYFESNSHFDSNEMWGFEVILEQ